VSYADAVLAPRAHLRLARFVVVDGHTISQAAIRFEVSYRTAQRWVERWLAWPGRPRNHSGPSPAPAWRWRWALFPLPASRSPINPLAVARSTPVEAWIDGIACSLWASHPTTTHYDARFVRCLHGA